MGVDLFMRGEFTTSLSHFEQSIALYNPQQYRAHTFHSGNDPGVTTLTWMAHILWMLGYPDQSLEKGHEALALAQELLHPYSLAWATNRAAFLHRIRREEHWVQEKIEALVTLSTELGLAYRSTSIPILQGWTLAMQQRREDGVAQLRQGLDAYRNGGAVLYLSWHLALLAEAYQAVGRIEEGLRALAEALTHIDKTGEGFYTAEVYRLQGELHLSADNHTEAEGSFHQALDIARNQHAKSWELRAAISVARLWQQRGKRQKAYDLLAPLNNWFTEGFGTVDLQEARTLLNELT